MTRIWSMSDLHLAPDFGRSFDVFDPPEHDVVVLAGDVWHPIKRSMLWAQSAFEKPVVFVAGNHEFYHSDIVENLAVGLCTNMAPRVELLEDCSVVLAGTRFLGCTLWTDFCLFGDEWQRSSMEAARRGMQDYRMIDGDEEVLSPADTLRIHERSIAWLRAELAKPFDGPTVVVTHHAPSIRSVAPRYMRDLTSAAFASPLDELVESCGAALWIHGHVHWRPDYVLGRTRVVCNPRGYASESTGFDPSFVVEV